MFITAPDLTTFNIPKEFSSPELLSPGRKPVGPVEIDWDNPLTNGLAKAIIFQNDSFEYVEKEVLSVAPNCGTFVPEGFKISSPATTTGIEIDSGFLGSGDWTLIMKIKPESITYSQIFEGGTERPQIVLNGDGTISYYDFNGGSLTSSTVVVIDEFITIAIQYRNEFKVININGVEDASADSQSSFLDGAPLKLFDGTGDSASLITAAYFYYFKRALAESELMDFHLDPYQFLKPAKPPVQIPYEKKDVLDGFWLPDPRFEAPELLIPGRKPTGRVEIDWENPLTKGLTVFNIGNSKNLVGETFIPTGAPVHSPTHLEGQVINTDTDKYIDLGPQQYQDFTVICRSIENSGGTASFSYSTKTSSANQGYSFLLSSANVAGDGVFRIITSVGSANVAATYPTGKFFTSVQRKQGDLHDGFIDNISQGSAAPSGSITHTQNLFINKRGTAADLSGSVSFIAHWGRGLSDVELAEFNENPYQFLIPA